VATTTSTNLSLIKATTGTNEPWSNDNLNGNWDKLDAAQGFRTPKVTTTTISASTTETRVHSCTVPAITVQGATFSLRVWGNYDNSATASSFTVRAKIGSIQLTAFTITTPASLQTNNNWWADCQIVAVVLGGAATGAWRTSLRGIKSDSGSGTSTIVAIPGATTIVNNTIASTFEITMQWANNTAGNVIRVDAGLARVDYNG
jgi:hypothetical protein